MPLKVTTAVMIRCGVLNDTFGHVARTRFVEQVRSTPVRHRGSTDKFPHPRGTPSPSGASTSSKFASQVRPSITFSVCIFSQWCPTNTTLINGILCSTL